MLALCIWTSVAMPFQNSYYSRGRVAFQDSVFARYIAADRRFYRCFAKSWLYGKFWYTSHRRIADWILITVVAMSFDGVPEYGLLAILTFAASKGYQCTSRHISTFFRMLSSLVRREARLPSYFRHNPFSSRVRRITFRILYFRTCSYIVLIAVIYCILKGIPIVSEK